MRATAYDIGKPLMYASGASGKEDIMKLVDSRSPCFVGGLTADLS